MTAPQLRRPGTGHVSGYTQIHSSAVVSGTGMSFMCAKCGRIGHTNANHLRHPTAGLMHKVCPGVTNENA